MSIRNEALFLTLSGYAMKIQEQKVDKESYIDNVTRQIIKYFRKPKKRYNRIMQKRIVDYLKTRVDPILENNKTSPIMLLIITLNYLLEETEHLETRVKFGHLKHDIDKLWKYLDNGEFASDMEQHFKLFAKL